MKDPVIISEIDSAFKIDKESGVILCYSLSNNLVNFDSETILREANMHWKNLIKKHLLVDITEHDCDLILETVD